MSQAPKPPPGFRELKPEERIERGDYYQTTFASDVIFPAIHSVTMTVREALEKWPRIETFYREVREPEQ